VVPVRKQRTLAEAAGGPVFESPIDHLDIVTRADDYNGFLLEALDAVSSVRGVETAQAVR
jgi:hypothetical protein